MLSNCDHNHFLENMIKHVENICAQKGIRFTKLRRHVFELIWQYSKPVKAYDLLAELQKQIPSAKPITIYRALDFLMEHGFIHKVHRLNAYISCTDPEHLGKPLCLLVCTECHGVKDSRDDNYSALFKDILEHHNFKCSNQTLEIEGVCKNCS
ncbi:MAG: Fur family transcriptional regulator [Pseudomonadota bacterium]